MKQRWHLLLNKQVWMLNQMNILVDILNMCSRAYYTATPIMSDLEYDSKYNTLEKLENDLAMNWRKIKILKGVIDGKIVRRSESFES